MSGFYNENANKISDLGGKNVVIGGSVKEFGGFTSEYDIIPNTSPLKVESTSLGISGGYNLPAYQFYSGIENTGSFSITDFINGLYK